MANGARAGSGLSPAERSQRLNRAASGLVAAGVLGGTLLLAITGRVGPPCLMRTVVNLPCPGCGMTRSLESLWRMDPLTAFRYHPLGTVVFVTCVVVLAAALWPALARPTAPIGRLSRYLARPGPQYAIVALLLGAWAVRLTFLLAGSGFFLN